MPGQGEFLIRNAYVITMDSAGDIIGGDVHVKDGAIVAAGTGVQVAPGVEILDGTGRIVLPGPIGTHWHMWNTILPAMAGDTHAKGYFAMSPGLGCAYTPADMYRSTRLAAADTLRWPRRASSASRRLRLKFERSTRFTAASSHGRPE